MRINNQFYINGFALSHAFKQRLGETGTWPIPSVILFKFVLSKLYYHYD